MVTGDKRGLPAPMGVFLALTPIPRSPDADSDEDDDQLAMEWP